MRLGSHVDDPATPGRPAPPAGLVLPAGIADAIVRHCAAALPSEGCGLLSGRGGHLSGGALLAVRFFPGTNTLSSPSRFAMDPAEVAAALDAIDRAGDRLAAVVHSHPVSEAAPSRVDLAEANYPDALLLVVSLAADEPVLRAWRVVRAGEGPPSALEVPILADDDHEG